VRNSELIRDYMKLDPRARDLCLLIKHWARVRKINDPYRGTLSSYAYVCMVLHYLMSESHCHPPIIPCLQNRNPHHEPELIDGFDCWYERDLSQFANWGAANRSTLGELLIGFFRLYATEFDFKEFILSPRTGGFLEKSRKVWGLSGKRDRHLFCVEDPFDVTHNLARGVDSQALYEIRGEFMRGFALLREGGSWVQVCQKYEKEWRGA
jgi:DNA polymerase sigma